MVPKRARRSAGFFDEDLVKDHVDLLCTHQRPGNFCAGSVKYGPFEAFNVMPNESVAKEIPGGAFIINIFDHA